VRDLVVAYSVYYTAIRLDGVMENTKVFMVSGITAEIQSGYPGMFGRHCSDFIFILISDTIAPVRLLFITLYAANEIRTLCILRSWRFLFL
jgi:hypothetical protein